MKIDVAAMTDPGITRETNEDHVWSQTFTDSKGVMLGLLIVCDGMGGHLGGECASYWATETVKLELSRLFCPGDPRATIHLSEDRLEGANQSPDAPVRVSNRELENLVIRAVQRANRVVYDYAQQKPDTAAEAGTTITLAVLQGKQALIANVGDSRTYLLRDHKLQQVTVDHSLVARLVSEGKIGPDDIFDHPQRNMIYRSLGQKDQVQVDIYWETLESGDLLLLCSDGLWEMFRDPTEIAKIIVDVTQLELACENLIVAANAAGGYDNIGVVLAKIA